MAGLEGWAEFTDTFDDFGRVLKRSFAGPDGSAVNTAAGYSEIRYTYDGAGAVSTAEYLDTEGNPVIR